MEGSVNNAGSAAASGVSQRDFDDAKKWAKEKLDSAIAERFMSEADRPNATPILTQLALLNTPVGPWNFSVVDNKSHIDLIVGGFRDIVDVIKLCSTFLTEERSVHGIRHISKFTIFPSNLGEMKFGVTIPKVQFVTTTSTQSQPPPRTASHHHQRELSPPPPPPSARSLQQQPTRRMAREEFGTRRRNRE